MCLAGCTDLFAGMAAKGPTAAQGQESGYHDPLAKAQPSETFLFCITPQPLAAAQALRDPTPNPRTSGHWVEDPSQLLMAPTLGKHHWEFAFLETLPRPPPPGSPPASGLVSFRQSQGCPGSRDELCRATGKSPVTEIRLLNGSIPGN